MEIDSTPPLQHPAGPPADPTALPGDGDLALEGPGLSFRRTLLLACLGSAIGGMLIASAFAALHHNRPRCVCAYAGGRPTRTAAVAPAGFVRIAADDSRLLPGGLARIDFETDSEGRRLGAYESVERVYQPLGVSLSTSICRSYVGTNPYVVDGRSRGLSAATVSPVWEGELTLRFHRPGQPMTPAGVHWFGLSIAHVFPGGTRLVALGEAGQTLGTLETTRTGTDFLGFHSDQPVHSVRLIPNRTIDPNYTIDDLLFDSPR